MHSFDYDPASVACAAELKRRFAPDAAHWQIESGSVLDENYLAGLGTFDIVYSWGVLHHTGNMAQALENILIPLGAHGRLFISIYNDQGRASRIWTKVKKLYNKLPGGLRFLMLIPATVMFWAPTTLRDLLQKGRPFDSWRSYSKNRGMSAWHDVVDWIGGFPFEVAHPETIFDFYYARGLELQRLKTVGGSLGNNEFVFLKK